MAEAPKKNPMAEAANHTARCRTEEEAPHKWNEAWGQLFSGGIPHDYGERVAFLKAELENCGDAKLFPKYGVGPAFREPDFGRYNKKGFSEKITFTEEELDEVDRQMGRGRK
jgi:hypothetical protein